VTSAKECACGGCVAVVNNRGGNESIDVGDMVSIIVG
jgi:hypothetical protein